MRLVADDRLDRYRIVERLGEGGMGAVYRARDLRLERDVALKVLRDDGERGDGVDRLLGEARAAATLEHPNVVSVYDAAVATSPEHLRGTAYITMELIQGKPLKSYVGDASVDIATRIRWLTEAARALAAAHAGSLIHRDVKPANIMVCEDGRIKVVDFGVARRQDPPIVSDATTRSASGAPEDWPTLGMAGVSASVPEGAQAGTPAYMAPEQLRGDRVDARADQFAWGVTAYELLCGRRPWTQQGAPIHLVAEILSRAPVDLRAHDSRIPPPVAAAVMRAMSKSPHDRFASMADVVRALQAPPAVRARWLAAGAAIALLAAGTAALALHAAGAHKAPQSMDARNVQVSAPPSGASAPPSTGVPEVPTSSATQVPAPAGTATTKASRVQHAAPSRPREAPLFFPNP
jgi:serine/threonine-protein kinase